MTTALDLAPAPSGVPTLLAQIHELLDAAGEVQVSGLTGDQQGALVAEIGRAGSRLSALRLRVLAAVDAAGTAHRSGATDTGQWAARLTHDDARDTAREVRLARDLDRHPATRAALTAGTITPAHADVITAAGRQLPDHVSPGQRRTVEESLLAKAEGLPPQELRRHARRALAAIEPDPAVVDAHEDDLLRARERRARARTRISLHDNGDGTISGHFTVPVLAGHLLEKLLHSLTSPRRARLGATAAHAGETRALADPAHARGLAFVELLEHLPSDRLPTKSAATLVVHLDAETLRGALKAANLETGEQISSDEVRRLACSAGLIPAVLDGKSVPLDLGRSRRLFSEAQWVALSRRHSRCAADGCERPYAWCELHHLVPWSRGGPTDLANAVPLCAFHHQRVHDSEFSHSRGPDGSIAIRRRM